MKCVNTWKIWITKSIFSKWPVHDDTKCSVTKEPWNMQKRSVDFNIIDYEKFIDIVLGSVLQITFKVTVV